MKKTIASLGLLILFSAFTKPLNAPPIIINEEYEYPVDFTVTNPCNGEEVTVNTTLFTSVHGVIKNNRASMTMHSNNHVVGIGSLGNTYQLNSSFSATGNSSMVNGQSVFQFSSTDFYISSGNAPNFKYNINTQIKVNANGTLTVLRFGGNIFEAECLGNSTN